MPTKQETFDTVVAHLRMQGRPAIGAMSCRYRTLSSDGVMLKCAAGCLIPDYLYDPAMESCTVPQNEGVARADGPGAMRVYRAIVDGGHDVKLVRELQHVHDNHSLDDDWKDIEGALERLARRELLEYSPPIVEATS